MPNPRLRLRADDIVANEGDTIHTWPDSSVNEWDFSSGDSITFHDNVVNGHAVARYDGSGLNRPVFYRNFTAGLQDLTTFTLFFVASIPAVSGVRFLVDNSLGSVTNSGWWFQLKEGSPDKLSLRTNANDPTWESNVTLDSDFHIYCLRVDYGGDRSIRLWRDGGNELVEDTVPGGDFTPSDGMMTIGGGLSFQEAITGDMAEFTMYATALSPLGVNTRGQALATKYNLNWTNVDFETTHPAGGWGVILQG